MRAMAQWWAAPTRRTMFARDMHARVRRQARPCQRLPWESRARVSSRPVRRQELDGCRARSTTAVKPRSRVDASRRTFCHHLHESVQCTHWPDAGPRRLNRAPSQADLALLRQVTPAGASLGETASAVPTAGWKYLASPRAEDPKERPNPGVVKRESWGGVQRIAWRYRDALKGTTHHGLPCAPPLHQVRPRDPGSLRPARPGRQGPPTFASHLPAPTPRRRLAADLVCVPSGTGGGSLACWSVTAT